MIHILTVHWKEDLWVDIQLEYFNLHISEPFQVYAFLNDLSVDHSHKYFYSSTEFIRPHPTKLNLLADMASINSEDPDDILIFIDGDAFPIGNIVPFAKAKLNKFPLIAVQQLENNGDLQPHPCFCMTTIGFWNEINGDWHRGGTWMNSFGEEVTDTGGNLYGILKSNNIEWHPMLRSNKTDLHPLFFGIYENLIYHHGAGFRPPHSRVDWTISSRGIKGIFLKLLNKIPAAWYGQNSWFREKHWISSSILGGFFRRIEPRRGIKARNQKLSNDVYEKIKSEPNFYKFFLQD